MSQVVDNKAVRLHDLFLTWKLDEHLKSGVIRQQKHPSLPLYIYNYTEEAQFKHIWDSCTTKCRGLIVDGSGVVVARPFDKFHNLNTGSVPETKEENLPNYAPIVTKKLDGSLGILWEYGQNFGIATRGSFASEQAVWATNWYKTHFAMFGKAWPEGYTPVFEIIYRENRIVVDYDFEGLVLLALINNRTGEELNRHSLEVWAKANDLRVVEKFDKSVAECAAENNKNEEGYVLTWPRPGQAPLKVKVKFEDYCRLHKVVTGMNPKTVWEMMSAGKVADLNAIIIDATYSYSFRQWLQEWVDGLHHRYNDLHTEAYFIFETAQRVFGPYHSDDRKAWALFFQAQNRELCPILFAMLDRKPVEPVIWKMIKPKATDTFKKDGE